MLYVPVLQSVIRPRDWAFNDTFNRADGPVSNSTPPWQNVVGTLAVSSNTLVSSSDANTDRARVHPAVIPRKLEISARILGTINSNANYRGWMIIFHGATANSNGLAVALVEGSVWLSEMLSGSLNAPMAQASQTTTDNTAYRIKAVMNGPVVSVFVDDVPKIVYTLSAAQWATYSPLPRFGVNFRKIGSPGAAACWLDDFSCKAIG